MEQNGQTVFESMILDTDSAINDTPKDMLDEPSLPRRNSADDVDVSRPRKRPAVMISGDDQNEVDMADVCEDADVKEDTPSSAENNYTTIPAASSALEVASENATDMTKTKELEAASDTPLEGAPETSSSRMTDRESLEESDTASEETSEVHIESVDDTITDHQLGPRITLLQADTDSEDRLEDDHIITLDHSEEVPDEDDEDLYEINSFVKALCDSFRNPRSKPKENALQRVMEEILNSDHPSLELRGFALAIEHMLADFAGDELTFETIYFRDRILCDNLPHCVTDFLGRTRKFGDMFYTRGGVRHIAGFLGALVKLVTKFMQQDTLRLQNLEKGDVLELYSHKPIATIGDMMGPGHESGLYENLRAGGYPLPLWFPLVLDNFLLPDGFLDSLLVLVKQVFNTASWNPDLLSITRDIKECCIKLIKSAESLYRASSFLVGIGDQRSAIHASLCKIFIVMEDGYRTNIKTHVQKMDPLHYIQHINTLAVFSQVLYAANPTEPSLVARLSREMDPGLFKMTSPEEYASIAGWTVKFPMFYSMITSARMEFRLRGLTQMTEGLVNAYRMSGYSGNTTPLIPYIIAFILKNKLVEYLVGPDSHYELISRCANVPSFLLVSKNMTKEIADALWQPVASNRDRRIIKATLMMHEEMIGNMEPDHCLDLCERINKLSFTLFDGSMMDFVGQVVDKIRTKAYNSQGDFTKELAPYAMLIRLMQLSFERHDSERGDNQLAPSLIFEKAMYHLSLLLNVWPVEELRKRIYDECLLNIREGAPCRTGSILVILCFLQHRRRNPLHTSQEDDVAYLKECQLQELIVTELASFLEEKKPSETVSFIAEMNARIDLLHDILKDYPDALSDESQEKLWRSIVANKTLEPSERDRGFMFYNSFDPRLASSRPILDLVFRNYLPQLDPEYFSPNVLTLTKHSLEYRKCFPLGGEGGSTDGVEQLWTIILRAADDRLARDTIALFTTYFLESPDIMDIDGQSPTTYAQVLTRCINQLTDCAVTLSECTASPDRDNASTARSFDRSLYLLEYLVKKYKNRPIPGSSNVSKAQHFEVTGEPLSIKVRWTADNTETTRTIQMGSDDLSKTLLIKLNAMIGGRNRTILRGQEIKLQDEPTKTLSELGLTDQCLLQVYHRPDQDQPPDVTVDGVGTIATEVMKHFDALYKLLSLPEPFSNKVWEFLRMFPAHSSIRQQLRDTELEVSIIYPQDAPHRFLYSLHALGNALRNQDTNRNEFILQSIPKLVRALVSYDLDVPSTTKLSVLLQALSCLNILLKDPETRSLSDGDMFGDPATFVRFVLKLLENAAENWQELPDIEYCVSETVTTLFLTSRVNSRVRAAFSEAVDLEKLLRKYLLDDPRLVVRKSTFETIRLLDDHAAEIEGLINPDIAYAIQIWDTLSRILKDAHGFPQDSHYFFCTALLIFSMVCKNGYGGINYGQLFQTWMSQLCQLELCEVVGHPTENDSVKGYASLLRWCIALGKAHGVSSFDNSLAPDLWEKLLFPSLDPEEAGTREKIPILHDEIRTMLYELLIDMTSSYEDKLRLVELNNDLFDDDIPLCDGYYIDRDRWLVGPTGFGGLINISNTCYLNSLMTQLFMNASFRQFFMNLQIQETEESRKLTYCLCVIFARLQTGLVRAYEPRDLVDSLTDFAGQPIDPTVQMDVDEFFNLLFDRLENEMPTEHIKALFRSFYGGNLVQQVKSKECQHVSERTEAFSAIQCDIKGKSTLHESLKAYVEGEFLEGDNKYRCATCDKLVDAVKRTCLKQVPDHLILHLKRFDFDLQTMNRSKINDYFEFPDTLDMRPYTMEYLAAKETGEDTEYAPDEFELVGVLVHTGTAESGHYYSYIRDRFSSSEIPAWYEFNDSDVSFFNPKTIPAACFGGSDNGNYPNKQYSAYMLFYQRKSSLEKFKQDPMGGLQNNKQLQNFERLREQIVRDNQQSIKQYCMFGSNYKQFLQRLLKETRDEGKYSQEASANDETPDEVLKLALHSFDQIFARCKDFSEVEFLGTLIEQLIVQSPYNCKQFLAWASQSHILENILMANPFMAIRQTFRKLITGALRFLRTNDIIAYGATSEYEDDRRKSPLIRLAEGCVESWPTLQTGGKCWNDFFTMLVEISYMGREETDILLRARVLLKILEMAVVPSFHPYYERSREMAGFGKLFLKPKLPAAKATELFAQLMDRCSIFETTVSDTRIRDTFRKTKYMPFTAEERRMLEYMDSEQPGLVYLTKYLEIYHTAPFICQVVKSLLDRGNGSPREHPYLEIVRSTLIAGVSVEPAVNAQPYLQCLEGFLAATQSPRYVQLTVKKIAFEVTTIGNSGGMEHLAFFQNLFEQDSYCNLVPYIVQNIWYWAPPLLVYYDEEVRESTEHFLEKLFTATTDSAGSAQSRRPFNELASGCFHFVMETMRPNRRHLDPGMFDTVIRVLKRCAEFQDDEIAFASKFEDLLSFTHNLRAEDDDLDVGSDDWAGSDMDSDVHEPIQIDD